MTPTPQRQRGDAGEDRALAHLQHLGHQLVTRNFHAQGGEIDLITYDPTTAEYVFTEVKVRQTDHFGTAAQALTPRKLTRMHAATERFFASQVYAHWHTQTLHQPVSDDWPYYRFDLVAIQQGELQHYVGVGGEE